jgi:hypothetical protein
MEYPSFDLDEFYSRLDKAISKKPELVTITLGEVRDHPLYLVRTKPTTSGPRVLLAGGFHGDEISGPWSIINFLEKSPYPTEVSLSILPLVSPTGFQLSRRANFWGNEPNNGYVKVADYQIASEEDKILKKNLIILKVLSKDAYVSLHEDEEEKFYIYSYGKEDLLDKNIKSLGEKYFELLPENEIEDKKKGGKNNEYGRVVSDLDGSFEHLLYKNGSKKVITVELPSKRDYGQRLMLADEIIKEICKKKYY